MMGAMFDGCPVCRGSHGPGACEGQASGPATRPERAPATCTVTYENGFSWDDEDTFAALSGMRELLRAAGEFRAKHKVTSERIYTMRSGVHNTLVCFIRAEVPA